MPREEPIGQDPARHLKALSDTARIIRLPEMTNIILKARRFEDIPKGIGTSENRVK